MYQGFMRFYLTYTQMYRPAMTIAVDLGRKANKQIYSNGSNEWIAVYNRWNKNTPAAINGALHYHRLSSKPEIAYH